MDSGTVKTFKGQPTSISIKDEAHWTTGGPLYGNLKHHVDRKDRYPGPGPFH